MNPHAQKFASLALRIIVAIAAFILAVELIAFAVVFGLIGVFSDLARPVAIISACIFGCGGILFGVASVYIAFTSSPVAESEDDNTSPTQTERIVAGFIGSLGGAMAGSITFVFVWIATGQFDIAFLLFHIILLLFTVLAYALPDVIPKFSLELIHAVADSIANVFG